MLGSDLSHAPDSCGSSGTEILNSQNARISRIEKSIPAIAAALGVFRLARVRVRCSVIVLDEATGRLVGVGFLIGGESGALIALLVAAALNLVSYWNADKIALAMHYAHEIDEGTATELVRLVRDP